MRCVAAIYLVHGGKLLWWLPYAMLIVSIVWYIVYEYYLLIYLLFLYRVGLATCHLYTESIYCWRYLVHASGVLS